MPTSDMSSSRPSRLKIFQSKSAIGQRPSRLAPLPIQSGRRRLSSSTAAAIAAAAAAAASAKSAAGTGSMRLIIDQFRSWRPWQQRALMAGIVSRCSLDQLRLLATIMEPVFHRDFRNCVRLRYPSAGRRRDYKPYQPPPPGRKKPRPRRRISLITEAAAAAAAAQIAAAAAAEAADAPTEDGDLEVDDQQPEEQLGLSRAVPELLVTRYSPPSALSPVASSGLLEDEEQDADAAQDASSATAETMTDASGVSEDETNILDYEPRLSEEAVEDEDAQAWFEDAESRFDASDARELLSELLDAVVSSSTSPSLDADDSTADSVAASVAREAVQSAIDEVCRQSGDSRASDAAGGAAAASSGCRSRLVSVSFATLSRQASAPGGGEGGRTGPQLKEFNAQLERIWTWISTWPEFERINLLSELVTVCSQQLIAHLADCIMQRIHDCTDIGILPDRTLLKIFSLLPVSDLLSCAQVCRHWWVLASHDSIWLRRCELIGWQNGLLNLVGVLQQRLRMQEIDWKLTYRELERMLRQARQSLPLPRHLTHSAAALFRARQQHRQQQQQQQRQPKPRKFTVAGLARLTMSLRKFRMLSDGATAKRDAAGADGEAKAKRREQQQQLDGVSVLERIHEEYADRRPLMKPILGRLKQFQESEDVALDIRPRLVEAMDLTLTAELSQLKEIHMYGREAVSVNAREQSESKERLIYKKDLEKLGQRGAFVGDVLPILQCRLLQGHLDAVQCLQFDERRLVTGSRDMSVRIWDVRSGRSIRKLYGHKGGVTCLHMWDNVLATGSWDMSVMLWSLEPEFRRLRMLTDHEDSVCFVYILPVSKNLVTAAFDATARVYEPPNYRQSALARFPSPVTHAAVAGELQLATAHADRQLRLTDLASGRLLRQFGAHSDTLTCLHASGDLLVTGTRCGRLHFWDARAGQCEAAVQADPGRAALTVLRLRRGSLWTGHSDGTIREWHLATMTCIRSLAGHKAAVRDLQATAKRVASVSEDAFARIWEFRVPPPSAPEHDLVRARLLDQSHLRKARPARRSPDSMLLSDH